MTTLELDKDPPIYLAGWGARPGSLQYSNAEAVDILGLDPRVAVDVEQKVGTRLRHSATDWRTRQQLEAASTLAFDATWRALVRADIAPDAVDAIVSSATILDHFCPSIAVRVLKLLGGRDRALTFDLTGGCGTFASALFLAVQLLQARTVETVVVVAAEPLTRLIWVMRRPLEALLFGDGAAAMVLTTRVQTPFRLRRCAVQTVADLGGCRDEIMTVPVVGCGALPPLLVHDDYVDPRAPQAGCPDAYRAVHDGRMAARWGAHYLAAAVEWAAAGIDRRDVYVVPHQPSKVVLDAVRAKLALESRQVASINETHGNLSSASVPMAFVERFAAGPARYPWTVLAPVGTGLTVGAALIENTGLRAAAGRHDGGDAAP